MIKRGIHIFVLVILLLGSVAVILPSAAAAEERVAGFSSLSSPAFTPEDMRSWQVTGRGLTYIRDGLLAIKGDRSGKGIISPLILDGTEGVSSVSLSLSSRDGGRGVIIFELVDGRGRLGSGRRHFPLKSSGSSKWYRFDLLELKEQGLRLVRVSLDFKGTDEVMVGGIRFGRPSTPERFSVLWSEFMRPPIVDGTTIGSVSTPLVGKQSFITVLYLSLLLVVPLIYGGSRILKVPLSLKRSLLLSLVGASLAFTLRMDYGWFTLWRGDMKIFSERGIRERIDYVYNYNVKDFMAFMEKVDSALPAGATVRPAVKNESDFYSAIGRYYLLPRLTSREGTYLWAYQDRNLTFDPERDVLVRGGKTLARGVQELLRHGTTGYLYRVGEGGA